MCAESQAQFAYCSSLCECVFVCTDLSTAFPLDSVWKNVGFVFVHTHGVCLCFVLCVFFYNFSSRSPFCLSSNIILYCTHIYTYNNNSVFVAISNELRHAYRPHKIPRFNINRVFSNRTSIAQIFFVCFRKYETYPTMVLSIVFSFKNRVLLVCLFFSFSIGGRLKNPNDLKCFVKFVAKT